MRGLGRLGGLAVGACLGLLLPAVAPAGPWININPGGGGAFTTVAAGPTGTIIAGSDLSGAYRSRDRGLSWDAIGSNRGLERTHVSAVGFDPVDARIIQDRKSTRLNSSHIQKSRMPSSA